MPHDPATDTLECLEAHQGQCSGPVHRREALSSTGKRFPRCDHHWAQRVALQEEINRNYPDSEIPPAWFDPTYAGESWNEN